MSSGVKTFIYFTIKSFHTSAKKPHFFAGLRHPHMHTYSESQEKEVLVDYNGMKKAISNNNVIIIDVREPEEIKEHGKIPNSINIPLGSVSTVLSAMSDEEFSKTYSKSKPTEDTELIFYCMVGKRSGIAQQNAINLGYKNAKNYMGSWIEWASKQKS